jgi:hypothetical protein
VSCRPTVTALSRYREPHFGNDAHGQQLHLQYLGGRIEALEQRLDREAQERAERRATLLRRLLWGTLLLAAFAAGAYLFGGDQ